MVKALPGTGQPFSDEALVLFEVLSPSNNPPDQAWRRKVYASIPNLAHYVTVAQRTTWEFCQLLDTKYLKSSKRNINDWLFLANKFGWIKPND